MSHNRKRGTGSSCSAVGCTMRRGTNLLSQVKMFSFPTDPVRRAVWCNALKRENWFPTKNSLICNAHFISGKPSLDPKHPDYVPSLFSFKMRAAEKGERAIQRYERNAKRSRRQSVNETSSSIVEMPCSCCVPGCRGNYPKSGPKVSVFKFPRDELMRRRWSLAIRRKDYKITEYSYVCEHHFKKSDIETEISAYDPKTGRILTAPLIRKRPKKGAVPCLRIGSKSLKTESSRETPEQKRIRIEKEQLSLALQKSLKNVSSEISPSTNVTGNDPTSSSSVLRPTEDQRSGLKRKRKPDNEVSSTEILNGTADANSAQHCHSNNTSETSQNQNFSENGRVATNYSALLPKVQIKEEQPWENEYNFPGNSSSNSDTVKVLSVKSIASNQETFSSGEESKNETSERCDTAFYKKPLKIDKRDETFGKFVACEMSDLHTNPELYLKTQQSILKLLVEAHFDLMSSNNSV